MWHKDDVNSLSRTGIGVKGMGVQWMCCDSKCSFRVSTYYIFADFWEKYPETSVWVSLCKTQTCVLTLKSGDSHILNQHGHVSKQGTPTICWNYFKLCKNKTTLNLGSIMLKHSHMPHGSWCGVAGSNSSYLCQMICATAWSPFLPMWKKCLGHASGDEITTSPKTQAIPGTRNI